MKYFMCSVLIGLSFVGCENPTREQPSPNPAPIRQVPVKPKKSESTLAIESLEAWLKTPREGRSAISGQSFAKVGISRADADRARELLWNDRVAHLRESRANEMKKRAITIGKHTMRFAYHVYGDKPAEGRSLFISMHGGGGAPKRVNDQQWQNQIRLYQPKEGVYVAPRAPTDTWNLWHQAHIDDLFDRLIENMIVFEDVNPNRVYIMGYSAGGDGVYQLAPRMADRFSAASMMAGHPNETSPLGLRNLPFAIHVGERDAGYKRNTVAKQFGQKLAALRKNDPDGYVHHVRLHKGKGHWMDRQDAVAVPWMAKHTRDRLPKEIVWQQDDVTHTRFYWLAVAPAHAKARALVKAGYDGQRIGIKTKDVASITIRVNDNMMNLDQQIVVAISGTYVFEGIVKRTIATLAQTLEERGDRFMMFDAEITVDAGVDPAVQTR